MFERLAAPEHVIAIRFSGKMTADDIGGYRAILEDTLASHERVAACVDFTGLADMTGDALVAGARADVELLGHIGQFERCAFVSDKEWPRAVVGFLAPLFPTLEMRVFGPDERDEALRWAAAPSDRPRAAAPAVRFLETTGDDVLAFEINGVISADEMPRVIETFERFLENHDTVRLLNRMTRFAGIDPAAFLQSGLVSMKLAAMRKVERYAVVGAPSWMRGIVETMNPAFRDMEIRTFPPDREEDAWAWLGASPAGPRPPPEA